MTDQPNAPLTFRWYDAIFNTARFQRYVANVELMESTIHQMTAQGVINLRRIDSLSEQLGVQSRKNMQLVEQLTEARNHIAIMTGAATEENTPYTVRGNHGADKAPKDSGVRSSDMACDSNRRSRQMGFASHAHETQTVMHQQDNGALLAVAAVAVMSDAEEPVRPVMCAPAYREPETPAYVAPEPQRESYSPPSRTDSDYSPSSSNDSSPASCD
jgi:hypothetical protein